MTGPDDAPQARLDFKSKEEFQLACRALSGRMHYLNRVAIGESGFVWEVAEITAAIGRAFEAYYDDPEIARAFGDGWTKGTLTRQERRAYLFKLMFDGK